MPAAAGSRLRRLPRDPAGAGSRPSSGTRSSGWTTRSLPAGGRASSASSRQSRAHCALRRAEMARAEQLPLTQAAAAEATRLRVRGRSWLWTGATALFLLAAFFGVKSHLSDSDRAILWQLRLPRVVLAGLVGALLSAAGATYQGVFRNPLADPYLLGVAAGAGLGATIAIAYGHGATAFNGDLLPLAAFGGGAIAVTVAYILGRSAGAGRGPAALVLAGVTVASFLTAGQTFGQHH